MLWPLHSHTHLYCSEVTHSLLLKDPDFTHLAPYLKGLPMEEPVAMTLGAYSHCEVGQMCLHLHVCVCVYVCLCVCILHSNVYV